MITNPYVSIIVPVFNTQEYLRECLDSLAQQSLKNIEIIIVNDQSCDESQVIIDEFLKKDARFKCIINPYNQGLGATRNIGAQVAKGDYIATVDSDDKVSIETYEKLYNYANEKKLDIAFCSFYYWFPNNENETNKFVFSDRYTYDYIFSKETVATEIYKLPVVAWNRIYSRKFYKKYITYPANTLYEDNAPHYAAIHYASRAGIINEPLYYYRQNRPDSIMSRPLDIISVYTQFKLICSIYKNEMHIKKSRVELATDIFAFTAPWIDSYTEFQKLAQKYIVKHLKGKIEWEESPSFTQNFKNKLLLSKFQYNWKKKLYSFRYKICLIPHLRKQFKEVYIENFR